jgi:SH3 domain protein
MEKTLTAALVLVTTVFYAIPAQALDRYVTDQFEINMRTGTSTANRIIAILKSGQKLEVLEQDEASQYSLVRTENGTEGYVLTRYLDEQPSGREQLVKLQLRSGKQKDRIAKLEADLNDYQQVNSSDREQISQLKAQLQKTTNDFNKLQEDTKDTIRVLQQNENLQTRINVLEREKKTLSEENIAYKDRTAMDWFLRGAGVSLAAFLLGIIVTRIRWRKRDSWGSY